MTTLYVHIAVVLWRSSSSRGQQGLRTHNPRAYAAVKTQNPDTWTHCSGPKKNGLLSEQQHHDFDDCDWPSKKPSAATARASLNVKTPRSHQHKPENALLARRKVIRLLIAVLLSFTLCTLPYHVRMMWQHWSEPQLENWQLFIPPITFVIFYLNSALNPLLYAFLSDKFRRSLIEVVTCAGHRRTSISLKTIASTA
jgi:hypothetical protein